jgi:cation diffusion facilitator CzcD-associated flavoprotein CzcO
MSPSAERTRALDCEVAIVGCGFAGIGMAVELQRRGLHDFLVLEAAHDVGGTWRDNRYPGVAVDIPSFTYSFSYAQRPDWSRVFAHGHELKRYADLCTERFALREHIRFHSAVRRADFHADTGSWQLTLADGRVLHSRYVICATGLFTQPKLPTIPGLERFAGELIHSARWPEDAQLSDARVGLIGTGATGVQLVPALAGKVARLTVFQRTPPWVLPRVDAPLTPAVQALLRSIPGLQWSVRAGTSAGTELVMVLAIVYQRQFPLLVRAIEAVAKLHMRGQVRDRALRERLTPRYGFGCNRPTFSNTYLASFNRDDVALETAGIREVVPEGVITRDGRLVPCDVLICATGFRTYERGNLPAYEVHGREGRELGAVWESERYRAYQGSTVPGFPNHFVVIGPYTATGSSWFAMIENQARHIARCIAHAQQQGRPTIEVREGAHERFFARIQQRQRHSVFFNNGCAQSNSYYFDKHGDALFYRPASGLEVFLESHLSPLSDYRFS